MISYVALGTNIEPREAYLNDALAKLSETDGITITNESTIYETEPVGYTNQGDFLNMIIEVDTTLSPLGMLDVCQSTEQELERERTIRDGPRTIDLDTLVYTQEYRETKRLMVPHRRMHERAFVLVPFSEIAPDVMIVGHNAQVKELLENLSTEEKKVVRKWMSNRAVGE